MREWIWENCYSLSDPMELTIWDETEGLETPSFDCCLLYRLSSRLSSRPSFLLKIRISDDSLRMIRFEREGPPSLSEPATDWSPGCHHLAVAWSNMANTLNTHVPLDVKQPWNHWFITGPGSTPRQFGQTCGTWCFSWKFWLVDQKIKSMTLLRKYDLPPLHRNMHSVIAWLC